MSDTDGTCEYVLDPDDPETWGGEEGDQCYVDQGVLDEDGVWNCPHDAEESEDLCIFHLSISVKDNSRALKKLQEKIENAATNQSGKKQQIIPLYSAQFGRFDLSEDQLNIEATDSTLILSHSTILGKIDFEGAIIDMNTILFRGAKFQGGSSFRDAELSGNVSFRGVEFAGFTDFQRAVFIGNVSFRNAQFGEKVNFHYTEFAGSADFKRANFNEDVNFTGGEFGKKGYFRYAHADES